MGKQMTNLINKLYATGELSVDEMTELLKFRNPQATEYLFEKANEVRAKYFHQDIFIHGIVELSNYCKNDCYYCGLCRGNRFISRYRLDDEEILDYCRKGYRQGVRTFLLLSGEDYGIPAARVERLIRTLKQDYPDAAVELSLGERTAEEYRRWHEAGASRYMLWHETAQESHFKKLHPPDMSLLQRKQKLWQLKSMGYQVGTGFMVGSPYQMMEQVVEDLHFLKQLNPEMVSVAPFLPTQHTRFEKERSGNGEMALYLLAIIRLMFPRALILADLTLENAVQNGRQLALDAGVNVLCASMSPDEVKGYHYVYHKRLSLKSISGDEVKHIREKILECGMNPAENMGDYPYPPKRENRYENIRHTV